MAKKQSMPKKMTKQQMQKNMKKDMPIKNKGNKGGC